MRCLLPIAFLAAACGNDPVHHLADAPCIPLLSDYTVSVTTPTAYACHDPYKAKFVLQNDSCAAVRVSGIKITGTVTSGPCTPPGPGTAGGFTVPPHDTQTISDFVGGAFCCFNNACPTPFQCDEHYVFEITTPEGVITKSADAHLSLDGCNQICPMP